MIAVLISGTVVVRETFHFETSRRVSNVTRLTLAGGCVIQNGANGVEPTVDLRAGVGAIVLDARLRIGAVCVQGTLMRDYTARPHEIASCALWTDAAIGPMKINAFCARVTWMVVAPVDV